MIGWLSKQPTKTSLVVETEDFSKQYDSLADILGVSCRMSSSGLAAFLREQDIQVFDLAAVERYMDKKGTWSWYPLRLSDRPKPDGSDWALARHIAHDFPSLYGSQNNQLYNKPVPYPVLVTVKTIVDRFGDDVLFLVAAPASHPDPFLAVLQRSNWTKMFVIERWNEPGFRG